MHGGDIVAQVLDAHGVEHLFTLCGGHISPILTGARARGLRVVDTRHEATAVFAADAVSRLTGTPGVAAVTAGPGATNAITAVKNAQLAQSAVVLLGGAAATLLKGRGALQDIDQMALLRPHVKWAGAARRVRDLAPMLEQAFRAARSDVPGPVFLECPVDLLYPDQVVRDWYAGAAPRGGGIAGLAMRSYLKLHARRLFSGMRGNVASMATVTLPLPPEPDEQAVGKVAQTLEPARRPLLVVGSQALVEASHAATLASAIERLGVPVYLSGMARGLLGRAHPLHRRHQRRKALREADVVVLAGVPCDFRLDYGQHIRHKSLLISVNRSSHDLKLNRRPDIAVLADPGRFLQALANARDWGSGCWADWHSQLEARDLEREREIDQQAGAAGERINPVRLCRDLDRLLPERSVLIADGGDFVATASYIVKPRAPLCWLDPGVFGTLGCGAGFALGAALCRPDDEVWALFGDGSVGYSLAEFDTFVRHQIPVLAIVGNDASWAQIAREQVKILQDDVGTVLAPTHYEQVVEGFGAAGFLLDDPGQTEVVLAQARAALASGRPALVNAQLAKTDFREGSLSM